MIILNERKFAEDCLSNGEMLAKPFQTLSILAKYYHYIKQYKPKEIRQYLKIFLNDTYLPYAINAPFDGQSTLREQWDDAIDKIVKKVKKYPLHETEPIPITKNELETIRQLENIKLEKLAFTLLCYAKLYNSRNINNNSWTNADRGEIKKSSKSEYGSKYTLLESDLYKRGLIEFPKSNTNLNIRVLFVDDTSKPVLYISDFRCLGYEYARYKGADYVNCSKCGILFQHKKGMSRKKALCKECSLTKKALSRIITCSSCGETVIIPASNKRSTMCVDCYMEYRRNKKLETQRLRRAIEKGGSKENENS